MAKSMRRQKCPPGSLPSGIAIAHKTGTLPYIRGDAGIIFGKQPLFLTVMVQDFSTISEANLF